MERKLHAKFHKDERNFSTWNKKPLNSWLSQVELFRIHNVFQNFHSGERIKKVSDSDAWLTGFVLAVAVSEKKKLRIQKYPDTFGRDQKNLHLNLILYINNFERNLKTWKTFKLYSRSSWYTHPSRRILRVFNNPLNSWKSGNSIFYKRESSWSLLFNSAPVGHDVWIKVKLFSIPQARRSLSSLITFWHKSSFRPQGRSVLYHCLRKYARAYLRNW